MYGEIIIYTGLMSEAREKIRPACVLSLGYYAEVFVCLKK